MTFNPMTLRWDWVECQFIECQCIECQCIECQCIECQCIECHLTTFNPMTFRWYSCHFVKSILSNDILLIVSKKVIYYTKNVMML